MDKAHLWEICHPYYCSTENYFKNGCGSMYDTWDDFFEAEGNADLDYNLAFRWDWEDPDPETQAEALRRNEEDPYYRGADLHMFFMEQRRGLYRHVSVKVCRADEDAVRAYLAPRLARLLELWEPMVPCFPPKEERPQ